MSVRENMADSTGCQQDGMGRVRGIGVKIRIGETHAELFERTRHLPIETRRGHPVDFDIWGWCDLPIRLNDAHTVNRDEMGVWYGDPTPSPYELQVMMVWGSWKAQLGMCAERDVIEGIGLRAALALVRENP